MSTVRGSPSMPTLRTQETLPQRVASPGSTTTARRGRSAPEGFGSQPVAGELNAGPGSLLTPPQKVVLPVGTGEPVAITASAASAPTYTKGPSYWAPPGFEGTALDPLKLAAEFMALPEDRRGDYFNAVCQFNAMLGSALNSTLRDIRGADVQKNWVNHMDTLQASTFDLVGLPAWLQSKFGASS